MIILKPLLPEDVRKTVMKKIEDEIKRLKGDLLETDIWGKRHLAYDIGGHSEGYYVVYNYELNSSKAEDFDEKLRGINDILRYMTQKLK